MIAEPAEGLLEGSLLGPALPRISQVAAHSEAVDHAGKHCHLVGGTGLLKRGLGLVPLLGGEDFIRFWPLHQIGRGKGVTGPGRGGGQTGSSNGQGRVDAGELLGQDEAGVGGEAGVQDALTEQLSNVLGAEAVADGYELGWLRGGAQLGQHGVDGGPRVGVRVTLQPLVDRLGAGGVATERAWRARVASEQVRHQHVEATVRGERVCQQLCIDEPVANHVRQEEKDSSAAAAADRCAGYISLDLRACQSLLVKGWG